MMHVVWAEHSLEESWGRCATCGWTTARHPNTAAGRELAHTEGNEHVLSHYNERGKPLA